MRARFSGSRLLGAFELCLKCSHLFNLLDARGAISRDGTSRCNCAHTAACCRMAKAGCSSRENAQAPLEAAHAVG